VRSSPSRSAESREDSAPREALVGRVAVIAAGRPYAPAAGTVNRWNASP
jgi:hypothetical protein